MSEFNFIRVDNFLDDINREDCFDTQDMDGITKNYRILLASDCPSDIEDCLDEDGTLVDDVQLITTGGVDDGYCAIQWAKGINGERTMSITTPSVSYDLGEDKTRLRAMFLVNIANGSGYVLAYCIKDEIVYIDGQQVYPTTGMVWSIKYGG